MEPQTQTVGEPAFQNQFKRNHCWGCGILNDHGLRIKSRWEGDEAVCHWQPDDRYSAGPKDILNGGIIATLLDCHSLGAALADAYRREGREIGSEPRIRYVTASLKVEYLRPTPLSRPVTLRARVAERAERRTTVACSLYSGEDECARAEVVGARVPLRPPERQAPSQGD